MTTPRPISRTPGVIEAGVDGDRVLMHPDDFAYYGLTTTGSAVWELVDGRRDAEAIAVALASEYDGDPASIRTDVLRFLGGLESARLITYAG